MSLNIHDTPDTISRRTLLQLASASAATVVCKPLTGLAPADRPIVFWATEGNLPGDLVMVVGGGLADTHQVQTWRIPDGPIGTPGDYALLPQQATALPVLQLAESCVKFQLPADWRSGLYSMQLGNSSPIKLNRPILWFVQPTRLQPGLSDNEVPPGSEFQIIGKDFLLADESGKTAVAIKAEGKAWQLLAPPDNAERFSVIAKLPNNIPPGSYEVAVHPGFGGVHGWSKPLAFKVKLPVDWPREIYDVKSFGALGDDVHDDTAAILKALEKCEKNHGGIIHFPYGTYRLTQPIAIPARTILRGDKRDVSILKWPEDEPLTLADFTPAAIYTASEFGLEDLTLIARKVDHILLDLSYENTHNRTIPKDFGRHMRPWSQYRDIFIRRVEFQHWQNAGHPDRNPDPKMVKKFWSGDGPFNIRTGGCVNFEVSDCIFQGGNNHFNGPQNGRITGCQFSNDMSYSWTCLGGGARRLIVERNDIRASSSFGFGSIGLNYVYSAHNVSHNFVRGEREAMTLDVSSMPTKRAVAEYWGAPVEVRDLTLRFPAPSAAPNLDGFRTGFLPGSFRGGQAIIHAYDGGPGAGQSRRIVDNTADTVTLEKPFDNPPETTPRRLYLELSPRKNENPGITCAWVGKLGKVNGQQISIDDVQWVPGEFIDQQVLIFDGPGAGQYRVITANTEDTITFDRPWDVMPQRGAPIGIWSIIRHMIVYKTSGFDTSAFAQLYGSGYDYVVDSCHVERNQGIWGQMGWFVQMNKNEVSVGYTYHKGIGPPGPTPEHNSPYGLTGLNGSQLRLTKFGQVQYPEIPAGTAIFVDKLVGQAVPIGLATVLRRNHLDYNERLVLGGSGDSAAPKRFRHAVISGNVIKHSAVGIQIGGDATEVLATGNEFEDVKQPYAAIVKAALKVV